MLHTRAANIRCDRYCSNFLDFGVQLNKGYVNFCIYIVLPVVAPSKEFLPIVAPKNVLSQSFEVGRS